jgi:uncharacterized repeat protein (TIGR03803 family)
MGGTNDLGTIYKIDSNGFLTTLISFANTNGANPYAGLLLGRDGNFYGTTYAGGANGFGTVFKLDTNYVLTTLASCGNTNGANPQAGLLQGLDGNFYGTTSAGGNFGGTTVGHGTVFELDTNGILTPLILFNGTNGDSPQGALIQDASGRFYGTTAAGGTNGFGTVFQFSVSTSPILLTVTLTGNSVALTWNAVVGNSYNVLYKTNLEQPSWNTLASSLMATNAFMTIFDAVGPDPQRFYQVLQLP